MNIPRCQGESTLHRGGHGGRTEDTTLLLPTVEKSPKNDTKITNDPQGENRPNSENSITSTKKRKLRSFMDSSQVDDLQRNYTKTTSSIRVGVKDGPSTATPDYDTSIEEIEDACLPEAQVPLTPKTDKDLTASLSPIFNLEKIAIPLRGKQIDTSSEDLPL
ncbi:MAG: hypothetical protein ASARMPRED_005072 [Alectoria sarmentosa]|nr:MAG: hypothetical protein ASARMPRED_005072 [Alectoria sarmentosa]